MNRLALLLLMLFPLSLSGVPAAGGIYFQLGDFQSIKTRAAAEDKLLFVHFTAAWCMPCQWMENNTFQDAELGSFVNERFLAVKVDIDERQGVRLKEEYEIVALPSMLIFDPRGLIVGRYEESMDAPRLYKLLQRHYYASQDLPAPVAKVDDTPAAATTASTNVYRPALIPPPVDTPGGYKIAEAPPASSTPGGRFGIQIGVFGSYQSAVGELERYEERFGHPVWIFPGMHEGRQIFRIVIGSFGDEAAASQYAEQLKEQAVPGIVKELSKL